MFVWQGVELEHKNTDENSAKTINWLGMNNTEHNKSSDNRLI